MKNICNQQTECVDVDIRCLLYLLHFPFCIERKWGVSITTQSNAYTICDFETSATIV